MTQGVRLTNMLFNHGPGSILETITGPVVIKSWRAMIANLEQEGNRADGPQLSSLEWRRQLEIDEPRLSSQLIRDEAKQSACIPFPPTRACRVFETKPNLWKVWIFLSGTFAAKVVTTQIMLFCTDTIMVVNAEYAMKKNGLQQYVLPVHVTLDICLIYHGTAWCTRANLNANRMRSSGKNVRQVQAVYESHAWSVLQARR